MKLETNPPTISIFSPRISYHCPRLNQGVSVILTVKTFTCIKNVDEEERETLSGYISCPCGEWHEYRVGK